MTKARSEQVSTTDTPFYHCYVRCVRRAYLCGADKMTGHNYDHRKQWIVSRLRFLSYVYAIDICAYAIMSNHYHVVLHVDEKRAQSWSPDEVAERWMQLCKGNKLVDLWLENKEDAPEPVAKKALEIIEIWRERLCSISWFMRGINETIARMANKEDGCKGRFWEGRFKSQALLDEAALLSCMTYVDLNPVRAGMADDLYESDCTSIQQRIYDYSDQQNTNPSTESDHNTLKRQMRKQQKIKAEVGIDEQTQADLMQFDESCQTDINSALPFTLADYFALVDLTGRQIREGKKGSIADQVPSIVSRLGIDPEKWLDHIQGYGRTYSDCAGSVSNLRDYASRKGRGWCKGVGVSQHNYLSDAS